MAYTPHTDAERRAMLETIGVADSEDLFAPVPAELRAGPLDLPPALSEAEVVRHLGSCAPRIVLRHAKRSQLPLEHAVVRPSGHRDAGDDGEYQRRRHRHQAGDLQPISGSRC